MRILVIGAHGIIGRAIVKALTAEHEVLGASRGSEIQVDIAVLASIRAI